MVVMADAKAQQGVCQGNPSGCTREQAYNACMAYLPEIYISESYGYRCFTTATATASAGTYSAQRGFNSINWQNYGGGFRWDGGCGAGQQWNEFIKKCDGPCNTKPAMSNVRMQGSVGTACSGGCEYVAEVGAGTSGGPTVIGGQSWFRASSMVPSGNYCSVADSAVKESDPDPCVQQGNLTQCLKPDGQTCATASSGKQFCWQPGENGIKASGNDAATKSPDGTTPKPPPLPPNNGGEWTQTGQSTVTTTINDTTQTSNVTGWQSSYGSQGQGANGNGASGEGNSGSGSGSGLGNGNGNGDDEGDDDGPGGPGAGVDDLYTPTDKTIASVFAAFKARVGESPLVDAIDGFFTVNASGGCPTWTVPASEYWDSMTWDKHCSGDMLNSLQAIGFVLMAIAAFLAAIWALS